jgi:hypothetical protein
MSRSARTTLSLAGFQVIGRFWVMAEVLILFGCAWSSAQQNVTLSPVVRQFVKNRVTRHRIDSCARD